MLENRSTHLTLHAREAEQAATACAGIIRPTLQAVKERAKRLFGSVHWFGHPVLSQSGSVDARIEREFNQLPKKTYGRGQEIRHRGRLSC